MPAAPHDENLPLALVHWPVAHGKKDHNRRELLRLNRRAAELGARVIVNTEMSLSGYGFDSRDEIAPLLESAEGQTMAALAELARSHGVYLAWGLAERDNATEAYYNAAYLLGPDGQVKARRRKVTAEAKWACPGPCHQDDTCDTPWGRLGLLICSETYFSLLPRLMALKGVDLLLAPANWPPGSLDPLHLWRCRALENGMGLAACNRSGADKRLDCSAARSCLYDHLGRDHLPAREAEPGIFLANLPLTDGRLPTRARGRILAGRNPSLYPYLAAQLNRIQSLTSFLDLPAPGLLHVHALSCEESDPFDLDGLEARLADPTDEAAHLAVLPGLTVGTMAEEGLARLALAQGCGLICSPQAAGGDAAGWFFPGRAGEGVQRIPLGRAAQDPGHLDLGPARVGLAQAEDLMHPELALALAKRGCDLVAVSAASLEPEQVEVLSLRCLEKLAVAVACRGQAFIVTPPEGHQAGTQVRAKGRETCSLALDTAFTRNKAYEETVDYQALLTPQREEA